MCSLNITVGSPYSHYEIFGFRKYADIAMLLKSHNTLKLPQTLVDAPLSFNLTVHQVYFSLISD